MAQIRPFEGYRFNAEIVGNLDSVVAPPYDVIREEQQKQLYEQSPYNIVRLILGRQHSNDTEKDNRYTRAKRDYELWREEGILRQDDAPALYVIRHTYSQQGRSYSYRMRGSIKE